MEGLLLLRIDAPLFFANVNPVKEALTKYEARAAEAAAARGPLQFIVTTSPPSPTSTPPPCTSSRCAPPEAVPGGRP